MDAASLLTAGAWQGIQLTDCTGTLQVNKGQGKRRFNSSLLHPVLSSLQRGVMLSGQSPIKHSLQGISSLFPFLTVVPRVAEAAVLLEQLLAGRHSPIQTLLNWLSR